MSTTTSSDINQQTKPLYKRAEDAAWTWLKNIGKAANKKTDASEVLSKETANERRQREENEKMENALREFKEQTSLTVDGDKLSNALNNFELYEAHMLLKKGFQDGREGVRNTNILSDADSRASFIVEHTKSILIGKQKSLGIESQQKEDAIHAVQYTLEDEKKFNSKLTEIKRTEYRHFSMWMAVAYVIFGLLLLIADFPISMGIATNFIDMPIEDYKNIGSTLELFFFAAGITSLSIYFKIMYDEYINVSIIKKERIQEDKTIGEISASVIRFMFKISIVIGIVFLLYKVGNLRNALNEVSVDPPSAIKGLKLVYPKDIFNYKLISFIASTILLPLVSGICLSVGLGIISNINNLKLTNARVGELTKEIQNLNNEHTQLQTKLSTITALFDSWEKSDNKLKELSNLFQSYYVHGFRRGHRLQFEYDVYENANSLYIDYLTELPIETK